MRRFAFLIAIAAAPLAFAGTAQAQAGTAPETSGGDVTVRAPERMVCRQVTRTATRMRTSRVCRPVSQFHSTGPQSDEEQIAEAGDRLDVLGADDIGTGCIGGDEYLERPRNTPANGPR